MRKGTCASEVSAGLHKNLRKKNLHKGRGKANERANRLAGAQPRSAAGHFCIAEDHL